ncbi:MAG: hypothetical protein QXZ66_04795 [Thermoproteota archaeon]
MTGTLVVRAIMPAEFIVTELGISLTEAEIGQKITVRVKVTNVGEENGSYTVEPNGNIVDHRIVTLAGGKFTIVIFELSKEEAGIYDVEISRLKGTIIV